MARPAYHGQSRRLLRVDKSETESVPRWLFPAFMCVIAFEYLGIDGPHLLPQLAALKIPLLGSLLIFASLLSKYGISQLWAFWAFRLLVIFTALTATALFHGLIQSYAIEPLKQQIGYSALLFAAAYLVQSMTRVRAVAVSFIAMHVLLVIANFDKFGQERSGGFSAGYFLGDGNDLSWSLTIVCPLALYIASEAKSKFGKAAAIVAFLVLLFGIVGAQSRGATLAISASLIYLWLRIARNKFAGLLVGGLLIVAVTFFAPTGYFERMGTIAEYQQDTSATNRIRAWSRAAEMAVDNPIFGVGAGSFNSAYGRSYRRLEDGDTARWISTHSIYFSVLGEYGFLGFAVFVGMIIATWRVNETTIRQIDARGPPECKWIGRWATYLNAAVVAYAVAGTFLTGVNYPHRFVLLGLTLGAAIAVRSLGIDETDTSVARRGRRASRSKQVKVAR